MKYRYIILLLQLCFFVSCDTSDKMEDDGTINSEPIDYSMFKASIDNSLNDKVVSRAVSYGSSETPDLKLYFDNGSIAAYTYNTSSQYYEVDDATQMGDKALYVYSSEVEDNKSGALVAAAWPEQFAAIPETEISLRNVKPRVRINYKYADTEAITSINAVSLCQIYSDGELSALPTLVYSATGEVGEVVASSTTDIYSSILSDEESDKQAAGEVNYLTGAYELYVVPQVLSTYDACVKFVIDGEEHLYYFKNKVSFESYYCYDIVFEIKMFEGAVSIELTDQNEYAEWEDMGDGLIVSIDPSNRFDSWDGSSISTTLEGNGDAESPYLIKSAADLNYFCSLANGSLASTYLAAHYRLEQNIDWGGNAWSMIGSKTNSFVGVFDGNGYTLKNIVLSYGYNNGGMFGYIGSSSSTVVTSYTGEIKNLSLTGIISGAGSNIAGVVGSANPTSNVENCHFSGTVSGTFGVGGIVGSSQGRVVGCSVINSTITSTTEPSGTTKGAGGVVGQMWNNVNIKFEYNLALNCKVSGKKEEYTGGLIGSTWTAAQSSGNSFAKNITTDNSSYMFGITGYMGGTGEDPTSDTYSSLYQQSYYTGDAAYNDSTYFLGSDAYTTQQMCNMLNNGDVLQEFDPSQNSEGWYWAVNETYDSPMPVYNSK